MFHEQFNFASVVETSGGGIGGGVAVLVKEEVREREWVEKGRGKGGEKRENKETRTWVNTKAWGRAEVW